MSRDRGRIPWNKGLTIETDERIKKLAANKGKAPWNKGVPQSEDQRKINSESHKGQIVSEEAKRKISEALKGRVFSEEHKKNLGLANIGKHPNLNYKHTEEAKRKISEAKKGCVGYWEGKHLPEEARRKIGEANRKRKGKQTPWNKGITGYKTKPCSEEQRKILSDIHIGMHAGDKNPNWNGGTSFDPYCSKFNDKLRARIRDRDNHTCQLCGTKENGRRLSVHHVHYDKPNCNPDLVALCTGCNGRVNVNRDRHEALFMSKLRERGLIE